MRDARRARLGVDASRRPHFLLRRPCVAVSAAGMAAASAARGSGRASAPRLPLLLLLALLWAPTGVRAVPDEDLSHRNKEPQAPAQQLQPAAVQGPEPARAEVSRTCWAAGAPGTRLAAAGSPALGHCGRRGGGEPAPAPWGWRRWRALLPGSRPAPPGSLRGEGKGAPSPASAVTLQSRSTGMLPRHGLRDDRTCPKERQILIPRRKFLTQDSGRLFVFSEDNSIGHFIVETARPKLLTQTQLCTACVFCQMYMDYEA